MSDRTPEQAFRAEYEYRGQRLKPFSFVRETAAYELGWKLPKLGDDDWDERPNPKWEEADKRRVDILCRGVHGEERDEVMKEWESEPQTIRTYPGMIRDCAIIVWLCLQPDSVCAKARRKPEQFEATIDAWAEKEGISLTSQAGADAVSVYGEILTDYLSSKAEPKVEDADMTEDPN